FETEELVQALEGIKSLKQCFPVRNSSTCINDIQRHVRGQQEQFTCVGGHKYFYLDWNLNIWRCETWSKPLGSVFDLDSIPDCRDRCTACMMSCYREASVLMHVGVAVEDAGSALARGHPGEAARLVLRRSVARSLWTALAESRLILRLAFRKRK